MRLHLTALRTDQFRTRGKAQHLHLDDFGRYLEAKRGEMRVTAATFWLDFIAFVGLVILGVVTLACFLIAAPVIRSFFIA